MFVGSGPYAPPEAIHRVLTPAFDVYSLGVVVYQALTGAMPFQAATTESILIAKATEDPIPLDQTVKDVPPGCARAVMRTLSRERSERPGSCTAFAEEFVRAARGR